MSFSRGDVVWLRTDKLEGGLGRRHPTVVISSNAFNDSHDWGYVVRGSHLVPKTLSSEEYVIKPDRENKLTRDTVFGSIIISGKWHRMHTNGGKVRPTQTVQLMDRVFRILPL